MLRQLFAPRAILLAIALPFAGCGQSGHSTSPARAITSADLAGTYNVVAKSPDESTILLGHLRFESGSANQVLGTWDLEPWGAGAAIPGVPGGGALVGTLHGGTLILDAHLSDPSATLGLIGESFVGERMTGSISLLPSLGFAGTFEAIRATEVP